MSVESDHLEKPKTEEQTRDLRLRLCNELNRYPSLAIAVSGGVDSTTLAAVAHIQSGGNAVMVHAVSPAVPIDATARLQAHALKAGWNLKLVDAGEFGDTNYRENPVNRCYYCKSNLYARISAVWEGRIASGANLDDLGDYRPGLLAASEKHVVHPLIDAGINKNAIRAIATSIGLTDFAQLPAQPCLSSRIETGIAINAVDLLFVHKVETYLREQLGAGDIRCRITARGVMIEVAHQLQAENSILWDDVCTKVRRMIDEDRRICAGFGDYRRGSAFLTERSFTFTGKS